MKIGLENGNTTEIIKSSTSSSRGRRAEFWERYGRKLTEEEEKVIESFVAKDPETFKKEYDRIYVSSKDEQLGTENKRGENINPDKVVFIKKKDGKYCIEITHDFPDKTSVDSYAYCDVIWSDPKNGIPESVKILSNWGDFLNVL